MENGKASPLSYKVVLNLFPQHVLISRGMMLVVEMFFLFSSLVLQDKYS